MKLIYLHKNIYSVCLANASISSMGDLRRSVVRKAARLAVYEATIINEKNHQEPISTRVDKERGPKSMAIF